MSINWQNLRPWNGSQNAAFEELCCQLAAYEQAPAGSIFIRKAPPDAGVECYWKLPNGDEWGWQAKFFLSPPDTSQWHQLDESVKTAIEKHPRLTSYTVCLPIDRQDPHVDQQKWFMDNWKDRVEKWQVWAQEKRMSVEFNYWGEHEICERLSREEHRGRHLFWFNKELFSQQWFENRIEEAIANVGPRYTPELNVGLPIARLFDGLGRTPELYKRIKILYGEIKRAYSSAHSRKAEEVAKEKFDLLRNSENSLLSIVESVEETKINPINFDLMAQLASESWEAAWECARSLEDAAEEEKKKATSLMDKKEQKSYSQHEDFGYERHNLYKLLANLKDLKDFAQSTETSLANISALLLVGNAGTGKTHLFCDVARQRTLSSLPTVLLLGGQFNSSEPWSQIVQLLGLSCTKEEFLGALEARAQARRAKAIIFIDALNEGEGTKLWNKHLAGILTTLSRYPWIGIAVSIRTSYERTVIPEGLIPSRLVREVHHGFADHEYQATKTFFDFFGIERPAIPLLVPEFQNPLFLKLFCQGLKNRGFIKVPSGLQGITAIFNFFIGSVNEKLAKPEYLDFDLNSQIVQKAVAKLAETMAEKNSTWLPREEAQATINAFLPHTGYENSLFRHMISEGIIAENRFRVGDDEWCEGIHFSYERFTDHLIAKHLLDRHLDSESPSDSFLPDRPLGSFLKDEWASWCNRGLVEAISIQIPERIKKELVEIVPTCADFQSVREAFIESLIWRDPNSITEATRRYVNEHIIQYEDTHNQFLNTLLTVSSNPKHPYNADFLHKNLMQHELADRDAWWSVFLHYQYGEHGAVDRLVDWAWSAEEKSHIDDEAIRLCGMALTWFLTTSNRFLRDRTTKALVSLLTKRIHVLRKIIREFLNVNDPYILERLFAVAYGCAMRSLDNVAIGELAKDIYEWIFKDGTPPPHILLRDYARGIIEVTLHRGVELDIDVQKVRPPYKSDWPSEIPSKEELEKEYSDKEYGYLKFSIMNGGDFDRYIIGTNSGYFEWSSCRLGEPRKPSRKEIYEDFVKSLTKNQQKAWEYYHNIPIEVLFPFLKEIVGEKTCKASKEEIESAIEKAKQSFRKTLGKKKLNIFEQHVIPYLNNPGKDEYCFDLSIAQRWIFQRVIELGWKPELFGDFDKNMIRYDRGRDARKPERIGKKYQWIAYHEFLARVSDNFEFRGDSWSDRTKKYEGAWQISVRDIDPSCLLQKTEREKWQSHTNTWWFPVSYDAWDTKPNDVEWLKSSEDLPAMEPLIEVTKPDDGSKWLVLDAYYKWEQLTPPEEERFEILRRDMWYIINIYIVRKSDAEELFEWAKHQNFWGRWMPESRDVYRIFLGEFYWSPAYSYHCTPYYGYEEWTQGNNNRIPKEVLVTAESYLWERGYDCSIDDTISIYTPCKWLVDRMGLRWNGVEGHFIDIQGNLIAFDPSVKVSGPGALLINKDALLRFLNENGYDILWTILGEKRIIGGGMSQSEWKGRLEINGVYRIYNEKFEGVINAEYRFRK